MRQCCKKFLSLLPNRLRRSSSIGPCGKRNHRRCPCARAHLQEFSPLHEWHGSPITPIERRTKHANVSFSLHILQSLPNVLHRILVLTCAAIALRFSELLALQWSDVLWDRQRSERANAGRVE